MPVKQRTKTAYVCAVTYSGGFDLNFDCVGVLDCKYALCYAMPPDGNDPCCHYDCGTCISPPAKLAAIEKIKRKLSAAAKEIEEQLKG